MSSAELHVARTRGLVVGALVAASMIVLPVFDDLRSHLLFVEELGGHASWFPDPIETLAPAALGVISFIAIVLAFARGRTVWYVVLAGAALGAVVIVHWTLDIAQYPGNRTMLRIGVLPAHLGAGLFAAIVIAHRHVRQLATSTTS
jgi:hypothetical protein